MRLGNRCTSCGQPTATAILAAERLGDHTVLAVPRLGVPGHVDDREAAEVLLGLDQGPVGEDRRAAARVDAAHDGRLVQAAVGEEEDTTPQSCWIPEASSS
jgi:hypothetical protein